MKLGLLNGIGGKVLSIDIDRIRAAESMGYDSVWTAEAYGADAVTPAAWILSQTEKINVGTAGSPHISKPTCRTCTTSE